MICECCDQELSEEDCKLIPYFRKKIQWVSRKHLSQCEPTDRYMWEVMIEMIHRQWKSIHEVKFSEEDLAAIEKVDILKTL